MVPVSPLGAMLVMPIPPAERRTRSFWMAFANDLSYLLPAFVITLGLMLFFGQAPTPGVILMVVGLMALFVRLIIAYRDYLERRRMAEFRRQYQAYLHDMHVMMNRKRLTSG